MPRSRRRQPVARSATGARRTDQRKGRHDVFKLLHISDLHLGPTTNGPTSQVREALDRSVPLLKAAAPDLVICSGDVSSYGSSREQDLVDAKDWLDQLQIPYLVIPGNHDQGANPWRGRDHADSECYEDQGYRATRFGRVFGSDPLQTVDCGPFVIVAVAVRDCDPDGVLDGLEHTLSLTGKPVIMVGHYPLMPVRPHGGLKDFGFSDFIPHTVERLRSLLCHNPAVRLYLCGHVHAASCQPLGPNALHLSTGSLGLGPSLFHSFLIGSEAIAWQTHLGGGPLRFWADAPPEYYMGSAAERSGQWSLRA